MEPAQQHNGNGNHGSTESSDVALLRNQLEELKAERNKLERELFHLHANLGDLAHDSDVWSRIRDRIRATEEERDRLRAGLDKFEQDFETRHEIRLEAKAAVIERTIEKEVKRLVWGSVLAVVVVLSLAGTFGLKDILPAIVKTSVKNAIDEEFKRVDDLKYKMRIQTEEASTEAIKAQKEAARVKLMTDAAIDQINSEQEKLEKLAAGARAQLANLFTASGQVVSSPHHDDLTQNADIEQTERVDPEVVKALRGSKVDATLTESRQGWVWMGNDSDGKSFTTNFSDPNGQKVRSVDVNAEQIYILNDSLRLRDAARTGKTIGFFPSGTHVKPLGRAVQKGLQWWIEVEETQQR